MKPNIEIELKTIDDAESFVEIINSLDEERRALLIKAIRYIYQEARGLPQDHVCAVCFEPIAEDGTQIRAGGRWFHRACVDAEYPLDYFIKQEKALSSSPSKA